MPIVERVGGLWESTSEFINFAQDAQRQSLENTTWTYEVKLDGYRAIGVKGREVILYSRNAKNFNKRFPQIADALVDLPADTVIDGEVVALDESGRPDFHGLQHFTAEASRIRYFVFDLLVLNGRDLTSLPLIERRKLLAGLSYDHHGLEFPNNSTFPPPRCLPPSANNSLKAS